jgi:hypothetical protein
MFEIHYDDEISCIRLTSWTSESQFRTNRTYLRLRHKETSHTTVPFRPGVQGVWRVTLNLYLDFSSAVIVTRDTEHFLFRMLGRWRSVTLILEKINIRSLKASWEATPDVSDSARTTTNKGMSKTVQARTISPDFNVNNHCKMSKFSKEIFIRRSWPRKHWTPTIRSYIRTRCLGSSSNNFRLSTRPILQVY